MSQRTDRISTWLLTICALVVTVLLVRRELSEPNRVPRSRLPHHISNWRELASEGHRIGSDSAPVTIVEFADFQCGFCVRFSQQFALLRKQYGDSVALVFRHYALPTNTYSFGAAVAAECAAQQGRFEAMHDSLFALQTRLSERSLVSVATSAGVQDSAAFIRCLNSEAVADRVKRDTEVIERLGSTGTPTLIVDGDVFLGIPDGFRDIVSRHVRAARAQ